jgi:protein-tyrosine phosphatase
MTADTFDIYAFAGFRAGQLAICPEPVNDYAFTKVEAWNADIVVTMITVEEFARADFTARITRSAKQWMQAAVKDFNVPESDLSEVLEYLGSVLKADGRVLIHCKGGQGRSGMLAMRLLVEQGEPAVDALARIRKVRPNAVETIQQEQWASKFSV